MLSDKELMDMMQQTRDRQRWGGGIWSFGRHGIQINEGGPLWLPCFVWLPGFIFDFRLPFTRWRITYITRWRISHGKPRW